MFLVFSLNCHETRADTVNPRETRCTDAGLVTVPPLKSKTVSDNGDPMKTETVMRALDKTRAERDGMKADDIARIW